MSQSLRLKWLLTVAIVPSTTLAQPTREAAIAKIQAATAPSVSIPSQQFIYETSVVADMRLRPVAQSEATRPSMRALTEDEYAAAKGRSEPFIESERNRPFAALTPRSEQADSAIVSTAADARAFAERLNAENQAFAVKTALAKSTRMSADVALPAAGVWALAAGVTAGTGGAGAVVIPFLLGATSIGAGVYADKAEDTYKEQAGLLVGGMLKSYQQSSQPAEYRETLRKLKSDNEAENASAMRTLIGNADNMFKDVSVGERPTAEVLARLQVETKLLRQAASNAHRLNRAEMAAVIKKLNDGQKQTSLLETEVQGVKRALVNNQAANQTLSDDVQKLQNGVQVTNALLFEGMSPSAKLKALNAGLDLGLTEQQRAAYIEKLTPLVAEDARVQAIKDVQTQGSFAFQVTNDTIAIASALGVKVPNKVRDAVSFGQSAFSVVTSFAINPFTGMHALAGALGGGGAGDPATQKALAGIQGQLSEVLQLQRQTLAKLNELDQKLTRQHEEVMTQFAAVTRSLDTLERTARATDERGLAECDRFETQLNAFRRDSPRTMSTYQYIQKQFEENSDNVRTNFRACRNALRRLSQLSVRHQRPGELFRRDESEDRSGGTNQKTLMQVAYFRPAYTLAIRLRAVSSNHDFCADDVGRWIAMPQSMRAAENSAAVCPEPESADQARLQFVNEDVWRDYRASLAIYVTHDLGLTSKPVGTLEALRQYQSLVAPFFDLVRESGSDERLLTLAALKARPARPAGSSEASTAFGQLLNIAALGAAQESMMAGVGMFPALAGLLDEFSQSQAGATPAIGSYARPDVSADSTQAQRDQVRDFDRSCAVGEEPQPFTVANLVCVFERHPYMLSNVLTWRLREAITAGRSEKDAEAALRFFVVARESVSPILLNRATRSIVDDSPRRADAISWAEDSETSFGFVLRHKRTAYVPAELKELQPGVYFKMKHTDGTLWYFPAPTGADVSQGLIRYRPPAYPLMATKAALCEEYFLYRQNLVTSWSSQLNPMSRANLAFQAAQQKPRGD